MLERQAMKLEISRTEILDIILGDFHVLLTM